MMLGLPVGSSDLLHLVIRQDRVEEMVSPGGGDAQIGAGMAFPREADTFQRAAAHPRRKRAAGKTSPRSHRHGATIERHDRFAKPAPAHAASRALSESRRGSLATGPSAASVGADASRLIPTLRTSSAVTASTLAIRSARLIRRAPTRIG